MKISSSRSIRWTQWLDFPMLIALGGVLAVLIMIEVLSRGGWLYSAIPQDDDTLASAPAAWVQQRELLAMCGTVSGQAQHPACERHGHPRRAP
ncbi:MAG: hypothetical protein EKK45_12120 [Curvibacter sp.]|nr:MAG: hypothetical protein EKK45_12120 [Curvibacter sp.]